MTKPKLKPCPFCGGKKLDLCVNAVTCLNEECNGSVMGDYWHEDDAAAAWNRRATK